MNIKMAASIGVAIIEAIIRGIAIQFIGSTADITTASI